MVSFPPCKINLGLNVLARRPDGFHDIETCFYPVPWTDILEVIPANAFSFSSTGIPIPGSIDDNLCVKAYRLIQQDIAIPPVAIHLHKVVPMGAGLGGGSSDAAHCLMLLNHVLSLNLSHDQLLMYAARLGSDCAFFLNDQPAIGRGRGEVLQNVHVELKGKYLLLVKPDIHIATADAYKSIVPNNTRMPVADIIQQPIKRWKEILTNDFETTVFKNHPAIAALKAKLYQYGARYAAMSGSGSSVFGIFDEPVSLRHLFSKEIYWGGALDQ